jgi:hypothetical protein
MDSLTVTTLVILVIAIAAVMLIAMVRARSASQKANGLGGPSSEAPASPPVEPPASSTGPHVIRVEGGGLWEQWPSIPAPSRGPRGIKTKGVQAHDSPGSKADAAQPPTVVQTVDETDSDPEAR